MRGAPTYETDGVEMVSACVPQTWVAHLRAAADAVMNNPSPLGHELCGDGAGRYFSDMYLSASFPAFRRFLDESDVAERIAAVLGWSQVVLLTDELLVKEPQTVQPTPWHQDLSYWPVRGEQACSVWIPLDPVTAPDGGLELVRGSHLWDKSFHPVDFDTGRVRPTSSDEACFDAALIDDSKRACWASMDPGDCIVFHARCLHRATGNRSRDRRRRVLVLRFVGANTRYDPRPRTLPVIWAPNLAPGAPLSGDPALFPTLWRA